MKLAVVEERFEYKGFPCVVIMQSMCFRTGYVGIPKSNKFFGKDFGQLNISCHGSLTYSDDSLFGQPERDLWWIGYDTGHYGDGYDYETGKKLFSDDAEAMKQITIMEELGKRFETERFPYMTLEYCKHECESIVNQILESEESK